jgi:hypothetical protein
VITSKKKNLRGLYLLFWSPENPKNAVFSINSICVKRLFPFWAPVVDFRRRMIMFERMIETEIWDGRNKKR